MSSHRLCSIVSLMLVMAILMPETEHTPSETRFQYNEKGQAEARQYCGEQLPQAMHDVCGGVYNSRFKKSNKEREADVYAAYNYDSFPYKSVQNARKMFRPRRGIFDECCLQPCSIEELRTYCGGAR